MREAAELLDGDAYYENMEIMGDMTITMTQLDASLYTPLFIPADEGISLEQKVYQSQARAFYDQAVGMIDSFLKRVPEDVVSRARGRASQERYEIRMELE